MSRFPTVKFALSSTVSASFIKSAEHNCSVPVSPDTLLFAGGAVPAFGS